MSITVTIVMRKFPDAVDAGKHIILQLAFIYRKGGLTPPEADQKI